MAAPSRTIRRALAPLKGSYRDYVVWQEAMASGPVGLAYQEYTRAMLPEILDEIPTV